MNIETIKSVYFVGAGGIGMSAILYACFLFKKRKVVAGHDRTPTPLTETLISEGTEIHYEERTST